MLKRPKRAVAWLQQTVYLLFVAAVIALCVSALLFVMKAPESSVIKVGSDPKPSLGALPLPASTQSTTQVATAQPAVAAPIPLSKQISATTTPQPEPQPTSSTDFPVSDPPLSLPPTPLTTVLELKNTYRRNFSQGTIEYLRKAAAVIDPELMQHAPPAKGFDPQYKNPCWKDAGGKLRCLPQIYITGMFHSGALSLAAALQKHPDVAVDACSNCQFWGEEGKAMAFYQQQLTGATAAVEAAPQRKLIMDNSPSTFAFYWAAAIKAHRGFQEFMGKCYTNCSEAVAASGVSVEQCAQDKCFKAAQQADRDRATRAGIAYEYMHTPLLMRAAYGHQPPQLVLLARNPLERLYSSFYGYPHYSGKYGAHPAGFTAYVKEMVGAFRACEADFGARPCALYFEALGMREEKVYYHVDQLLRGTYSVFLREWIRYFGAPEPPGGPGPQPAHLLVLDSTTTWFKDPRATLERVLRFAGLDEPQAGPELDQLLPSEAAKSYSRGQPPMEAEARQLLLDFYQPFNEELALLTGNPVFREWNKQ